MKRVVRHHLVDEAGLARLRQPRNDLVREAAGPGDRFEQVEGPFRHYHRELTVGAAEADGRYPVTERTGFELAIPLWRPLFQPLMGRALGSADRTPRTRWWWPREVVSRPVAELISVLCLISVMAGYLGVLIGQTISFAATDFGASHSAQANTLAGVRVGVLLSLLLIRRADRTGRRPVILGFTGAAIVCTMLGALAPDLLVLGATQTVARGFTTGLITLMMLAAAEEAPAGARAFTISLITITAALGAGMVVWVLPLAGASAGGWRIIYLLPGLFLPLLWRVGRQMPETRRFGAASHHGAPATINWRRFALVAMAAFATSFFASPVSQLRNDFLRTDRGFSAARVSLFQLVVSTPAGLAVVAAGVVADRFGRRAIAAGGLAAGAVLMALSYQLSGAGLWLAALAGTMCSGAAFPASRGYTVELFPTRARARVGGLLDVIGVTGSATGLVLAGFLWDRWQNPGRAIGVLVVAPLAVAALILFRFPETAHTELEAFNPSDPGPASEPPASRPEPADPPVLRPVGSGPSVSGPEPADPLVLRPVGSGPSVSGPEPEPADPPAARPGPPGATVEPGPAGGPAAPAMPEPTPG